MKHLLLILTMLFSIWGGALAQTTKAQVTNTDNRIDLIRPDAPALAPYGPYDIGVRTLHLVHKDVLDIVDATPGKPIPTYDRGLTVEVWYPANLPEGIQPRGEYDEVMTRDGVTRTTLIGRAVRGMPPNLEAAPYPLIIISHGYPGNRYLLSDLGENLASKGYITVSIDHTDSLPNDYQENDLTFASTLLNRPLDDLFVLNEIARLGQKDNGSFLAGLVNANKTGLIGYSMGGYGVVNVIGGGFNPAIVNADGAPPDGALAVRAAGNKEYEASMDPRIKAAIAIAPWGMNYGFWTAKGLAGIKMPVFFMAGSADKTAGYENGTKAIFEAAVNANRYLLTFWYATHEAAAPIPAPTVTWTNGTFNHYADPVWNTVRMDNIAEHFATAFFGLYIKGDEDMKAYLDLVENSNDGVWSVDKEGNPTEKNTYWHGFKQYTANGLSLEHKEPGE